MDNRVFWSVLCALLVFSGLTAFGYSLLVAGQREAVRQAQEQAAQQAQKTADQVRREALERQRQQVAYAQWLRSRSRLQPDQRCVGGVVVEVHGSTYTQIGYPGQPAHCAGDYADQPIH